MNNHVEKDYFFKNKKQNKNEVANKVALITNELNDKDIWIVDSGSSSHMMNQKLYFKEKMKIVINVAKSH